MKIKVLKKTPDELRIEIEGEGHTFCNLLQKVLLEDKDVEMAGYDISHPLASNPVVYVRMKKGRNPEKALLKAVERIRQKKQEFQEAFESAVKQ